jgi:hypothetical protein
MATSRSRRASIETSNFPSAPLILIPGGDRTIERGYGSALKSSGAATIAKFNAADALIAAEDALSLARSTGASAATITALAAAYAAADAVATGLGV